MEEVILQQYGRVWFEAAKSFTYNFFQEYCLFWNKNSVTIVVWSYIELNDHKLDLPYVNVGLELMCFWSFYKLKKESWQGTGCLEQSCNLHFGDHQTWLYEALKNLM